MSETRILLIEDEDALRLALGDALRAEGYRILEAEDGVAGLDAALVEQPDLVLLDLMLPRRDGFSVLRALRSKDFAAPILILSARGEEWDRVQGFEFGADDYLVKPFSTQELLWRIKVALRRAGATESEATVSTYRFGNVEVDFAAYCVMRGDTRHPLSRKELDLLRYFLNHPGEVLERSRLLDEVWGEDEFPTTRTIDTHVLKLRKKIEQHPESPRHLCTVHGVGYRFDPAGVEAGS